MRHLLKFALLAVAVDGTIGAMDAVAARPCPDSLCLVGDSSVESASTVETTIEGGLAQSFAVTTSPDYYQLRMEHELEELLEYEAFAEAFVEAYGAPPGEVELEQEVESARITPTAKDTENSPDDSAWSEAAQTLAAGFDGPSESGWVEPGGHGGYKVSDNHEALGSSHPGRSCRGHRDHGKRGGRGGRGGKRG